MPDTNETVLHASKAIIDAIQTGEGPDWMHFHPDKHAAQLPEQAGTLRRIINGPTVAPAVEKRKIPARGASHAQRNTKLAFHLLIMFLLAALTAALLMAVAYLGLTAQQENIARIAVVVALILAFASSVWKLARSDRNIWKSHRETSETLRWDIGQAIMDAEVEQQPGELPAYPLQIAYFERFQLEAQISYYSDKIQGFQRTADRTDVWSGVGIALAAITLLVISAVGIGALGEQGRATDLAAITATLHLLEANSIDTWLILILFVSIAIYAFMFLASRNFGDHRGIYHRALADLLAVRYTELTAAKKAAADGNAEPMRELARHVHKIMRTEHLAWLKSH